MVARSQNYVGFWSRLVANVIDSVILSLPTIFIKDPGLNLLLSTFIYLAYFVWMNGMYGATVGKMIIKAKIVKEDGAKITYSDALLREIGSVLSFLVFGLGYLNIGWDKKKQGWHDKIAKTVVVGV